MAVISKDIKKKTRPPTFQHLPRDRATKLKKEWVERKKLKSQWRTQKRKEGLVAPSVDELTRSSLLPHSEDQQAAEGSAPEALEDLEVPKARGSEDDSDSSPEDSQPGSSDDSEADGKTTHGKRGKPAGTVTRLGVSVEEDRESSGPARKKVRFTQNNLRTDKKPFAMQGKAGDPVRNPKVKGIGARVTEASSKPEDLSLRDLERMAYSPASLHTFKADPLHKRKVVSTGRGYTSGPGRGRGGARGSPQSTGGRGGPAGRGARGVGGSSFGARGAARGEMTGRGQPNMKLRMNAMLERIKRDHT